MTDTTVFRHFPTGTICQASYAAKICRVFAPVHLAKWSHREISFQQCQEVDSVWAVGEIEADGPSPQGRMAEPP